MSAAAFPTLSSGSMYVAPIAASNAIAMYPLDFSPGWDTEVVHFMNDSEQRWTKRYNLFGCTLNFRMLNGYDLGVLYSFFQSMRGAYTDDALLFTFSLTLAGVTYDFCVFDQDSFEDQVDAGETHSLSLRIKQLMPDALAISGRIKTFGLGGLCGAFTDGGGVLVRAVWIGNSWTFTVPDLATQLQLGINDDFFSDNVGSFSVTVNGVGYTVAATTMPWLFTNGGTDINGIYPFGVGDGTNPVVVTGLEPGMVVAVNYVSGTVNADPTQFPATDADGYKTGFTGLQTGTGTFYPAHYMSGN